MTPALIPQVLQRLSAQIGRVVFGSEMTVRHALVAYMVHGHLLFEGPPGTAKTLFARAFARSMGLELGRIQCTPDLMPADVIGTNLFDFRSHSFTLSRGPVFTDLLLADEINRTPPKTQSALLQAMQERCVTIDGTTHALPGRFTVLATQNPIEHEGTYPLPEAQLDRFLFKLIAEYPAEHQELEAVMAHCSAAGMPDLDALGLGPILHVDELDALREVPAKVRIEPDIGRYAVALSRATREHPSLAVGLSTRAATMLAAAARAWAACDGRDYVVPDDVKYLFHPLARHRVITHANATIDGVNAIDVLSEVLGHVPAPR